MAHVLPDPALFDRDAGQEKAGIAQRGEVTRNQRTPLLALSAFGGKAR
jgi:hypothetical protein